MHPLRRPELSKGYGRIFISAKRIQGSQPYIAPSGIRSAIPFKQAITGGTGAYIGAKGELTVDEAGDGPAHLTFALVR